MTTRYWPHAARALDLGGVVAEVEKGRPPCDPPGGVTDPRCAARERKTLRAHLRELRGRGQACWTT